MAFRREKKRIGDILLEEQIITQEQLEEALATAKNEKKKINVSVNDISMDKEKLKDVVKNHEY